MTSFLVHCLFFFFSSPFLNNNIRADAQSFSIRLLFASSSQTLKSTSATLRSSSPFNPPTSSAALSINPCCFISLFFFLSFLLCLSLFLGVIRSGGSFSSSDGLGSSHRNGRGRLFWRSQNTDEGGRVVNWGRIAMSANTKMIRVLCPFFFFFL